MSEISQDQVSDAVASLPSARVLPFERPQNPMQRAVQIRAQEQIERARTRPKIHPVRLVITLAIALLPVLILLGAADTFARTMRMVSAMYAEKAARAAQAAKSAVPARVPTPEQRPGVIFVVPNSSDSAQKVEKQPAAPAP